jgi:hypothetical protein
MNKLLSVVLALYCFNCVSQDTGRLENLKRRFELIAVPFNSWSLNENPRLIANSKKMPLSQDEILRYILSGNRSGLSYKFEKYDMETGESKGFEERAYKFYPVYRIEQKELLILIVLRTSVNTQSYFLSVYNKGSGKTAEAIEINKLDAEDEYRLLQSSYLDRSLQLRIFKYAINPEYLKNIKAEQNKSIITEMVYQVDGNLKLISKTDKKSYCTVAEFFQKNKKCIDDDPMKNLPID